MGPVLHRIVPFVCLLHPKHLGGCCLLFFLCCLFFRAFNRRQSQILWGFLFMGNRKAKVKFFVDYFFVISGCGGDGGFCPNCRDAAKVLCHCNRSWERGGGGGTGKWAVCVCVRSSEAEAVAEFIDIWKVKLADTNMNLGLGLGMWMWIYVGRHACAAATLLLFFSIFCSIFQLN